MLQPIAQITWSKDASVSTSTLKKITRRSTVSSRKISHRPRVHRNRDNDDVGFPRNAWKYAPVPARNTNSGAQKWVIQRVKNSIGVVFATLVGSNNVA